jgi:MinD-like ATPase involved in chromosome partitioning or flagellar assembly
MLKLFKKNDRRIVEGPVIWQGGQAETTPEPEKEITHLFNIPVSPRAIPGDGVIITIQCAKHGDGATTVATNLAALLAKGNPEKVVLADLDGYGSVRSRLGLPAGEFLVNILDWEDVQGTRDMTRALITHSSGIVVVPGVIHFDHTVKVKPNLILKMLTILKNSFDVIILDCPPVGHGNNTWAAALVSDAVITVIKPDRTSLDMYIENTSFMNRLGCGDRLYTILNQAGFPGGIKSADLVENKELGITISAVLPYSATVAEENNRRRLVAQTKPRDIFSLALSGIVELLLDDPREEVTKNAG